MGTSRNPASQPKDMGRRSFFAGLLGIGTAGVGLLLSIPVLRYVLFPLTTKTRQRSWSALGPLSQYKSLATAPVRKTVTFSQQDGWRQLVSAQSVYVTHSAGGKVEVLSAICPHLGCTVSWQAGQDRFVCPCHGSEFDADGKHIAGPSPRNMDRLPLRVDNGQLEVEFQYYRPNVPNQELMS
jgi:menaquinol-cytochrome c reductase iron-sulfur subunit